MVDVEKELAPKDEMDKQKTALTDSTYFRIKEEGNTLNQKEETMGLLKNKTTISKREISVETYVDDEHYANKELMEISNESLDETNNAVLMTENYGKENELITECFRKYPLNNDINIVAMKIGLIDVTNSTNISRFKSKINVAELASIIASIPNIDERIKDGDFKVVNEIAKSNGKINLFSFASKYCCYHNMNVYEKDDYSIFDSVLTKILPKYFNDIKSRTFEKWRKNIDYKSYNEFIGNKLDELGITTPYKRRKFDYFIWFRNR